MRPLLDNIDEVAGDVGASQPAASTSHVADGPIPSSIPTATQVTPDRGAFSFFRSYRFSPMPMPGARSSARAREDSQHTTSAPGSPDSVLHRNSPSEDIIMNEDSSTTTSAPVSGTAVTSPLIEDGEQEEPPASTARASGVSAEEVPGASRQVVPMLLVGVRSASLPGLPGAEQQNPRSPGTSDPQARPQASASANSTSPRSNAHALPQTFNSPNTGVSDGREPSGFVLWILGGLYPANHPIVIAPSLLGDDAMSYDELLRLAEVLGNVKPPTASSEEINKSDLKVVKASSIAHLHIQGDIREITAERCLGACLSFHSCEHR